MRITDIKTYIYMVSIRKNYGTSYNTATLKLYCLPSFWTSQRVLFLRKPVIKGEQSLYGRNIGPCNVVKLLLETLREIELLRGTADFKHVQKS